MVVLAVRGVSGFIVYVIIAAYIFLLISLYKVYKSLEYVGYSIKASAIKVSNKVIAIGIPAVLLVLSVVVHSYNYYPMDWNRYMQDESTELDDIRKHLVDLGMPEQLAGDLAAEDLLACEDATFVSVEYGDSSEGENDGIFHFVSVNVCLNADRTSWKVIGYFSWDDNPGFYGTEAVVICGDNVSYEGGDFSGRLICHINGEEYISDYYELGVMRDMHQTPVYGTFSIDDKIQKCRGYISYEATVDDKYTLISAGAMYFHHKGKITYPAQTVLEYMRENSVFILKDDMYEISSIWQSH